MGKLNLLSMKGSILGIFAIILLILLIPLVVFVSQQKQTSHEPLVTPTPETLASLSGQGTIAGYVYHDLNKNGERETEEKPFPAVKVLMKHLAEKGDQVEEQEIKTDASGYFKFRFPLGSKNDSYMIKVTLPENYKTIESNPLILTNLSPKEVKLVEFGLTSLIEPTIKRDQEASKSAAVKKVKE